MADRALNVAAIALAVLMPLALGLAVALVQPSALIAVLVLWGAWSLAIGVIVLIFLHPVRPQISYSRNAIRTR